MVGLHSVWFGWRMPKAISDAQKTLFSWHHTRLSAEAGLWLNLMQEKKSHSHVCNWPLRCRCLKKCTRKHTAHKWPVLWPTLLADVGPCGRSSCTHLGQTLAMTTLACINLGGGGTGQEQHSHGLKGNSLTLTCKVKLTIHIQIHIHFHIQIIRKSHEILPG